jgi:hypothetical protein
MTQRIFELKVSRITQTALYPTRDSDCAFNLYLDATLSLPPFSLNTVSTGIRISVPKDLLITVTDNDFFTTNEEAFVIRRRYSNVLNFEITLPIRNLTAESIPIYRGEAVGRLICSDRKTNIEHKYILIHFEGIRDVIRCLRNRELGFPNTIGSYE